MGGEVRHPSFRGTTPRMVLRVVRMLRHPLTRRQLMARTGASKSTVSRWLSVIYDELGLEVEKLPDGWVYQVQVDKGEGRRCGKNSCASTGAR